MTDIVDVVAAWPDPREVTLRVHVESNIGRATPRPTQPAKDAEDVSEGRRSVDWEPPAIVYPIDEVVLRTQPAWIAFLEDATRVEKSGAVLEAICLRADLPSLLKRLNHSGPITGPIRVEVGKRG